MKVYLIGNTLEGHYKIGKSEYPEFRVQDLDRPKLPFSISVVAEFDAQGEADRVEKELHQHFAKNKSRGEWFWCIKAEEFMQKAEEFTGTNPKPGRTDFSNVLGKVGKQKDWEKYKTNVLDKMSKEKLEKLYKGLDAWAESKRVIRAEERKARANARKNSTRTSVV